MYQFKAALLDDNKEQLQLNRLYLEQFGTVQTVAACLDAKTFLAEVKDAKPDVLFLDLNLGDSYMTGMEVAFELKLPVLFVSSNTSQYVKEMEQLKRDFSISVDHLTKPFSANEFERTATRFLAEVQLFANQRHVYLDFRNTKRNKIAIDDIVYLSSDKANGAESNNKQIHFVNRRSENLIDFSFSKMEEKGFVKTHFITIHKSFRVNKNHIKSYDRKNEKIEVNALNIQGKLESRFLSVSENYQAELRQYIK